MAPIDVARCVSMRLSDTAEGQSWLSQFRPEHVQMATAILNALVLVPTSEFRQWTARKIRQKAKAGRMALYAEREFPPGGRFFPELAPGKTKRSVGRKGPALIKPRRGSPYVGSEGIVAQLLSELAKRRDVKLLLTPGPDRLRPQISRKPTQRLVIVTDVIGSGTRITTMLDALWRTETVRSWYSHLRVSLEVIVFSYAATDPGLALVRSHRFSPQVWVKRIVPTLDKLSDNEWDYHQLAWLCREYDPRRWEEDPGPLGYKEAGTLLAFGHGCPNTTPRLFWASGKHWRPLFPDRSAVELDRVLHGSSIVQFGERLAGVNRTTLADPALIARFGQESREALLVLATISHGVHDPVRLASRTGLDVARIVSLLEAFAEADWTDAANVITVAGLAELRAARRVAPTRRPIPVDRVSMYFPTSLRG